MWYNTTITFESIILETVLKMFTGCIKIMLIFTKDHTLKCAAMYYIESTIS